MGCRDPREDEGARDRGGLSRGRAQSRRSHRGGRHPGRHPAGRHKQRDCANGPRSPAGAPKGLLFSPDGETVVSTGLDGALTLWDAERAAPRGSCGATRTIGQPFFSSDGATLYTASDDGTVIAWDIDGSSRLGRPFTFTHDRTRRTTNARPASRGIQPGRPADRGRSRGEGHPALGCDRSDPEGPPLLETGGEVKALAFSPDGRTLAAVTASGKATLWDVGSRSLRRGPFLSGRSVGVSFSADGTMLATAGSGGVKLWDVRPVPSRPRREGKLCRRRRLQPDRAPRRVRCTDTRESRSRGLGRGPALADRNAAAAAGPAAGPLPSAPTAACSRPAATTRSCASGTSRSGKLIRELEQNVGGVLTLEFSSDGKTLAISGSNPSRPSGMLRPERRWARGFRPAAAEDARPLPRRTPSADDGGQRPGSRLGHRPGVLEAARLRQSPTAR